MRQPPLIALLPDLQKPLRDAIRGVTTIAEATEEMLEPAANLLPEHVRKTFRDALLAVESAGKRLVGAPIGIDHIETAAEFVRGKSHTRPAAASCASVICFAWEHLQTERHGHHFLISETLLFNRLMGLPEADTPGTKAAALLNALRTSNVVGRMPGVTRGITGDEQISMDIRLTAIVVWLLSVHGGDLAEEEKILDLSAALMTAIGKDILASFDDPEELAMLLVGASEHL